MSEVALRIAGKTYMVACGDGEEAQLVKLGNMIDSKLQALGTNLSAQDTQNLLFAALLLADELDEVKTAGAMPDELAEEIAEKLDQLAQSLENCASKLEGGLTPA